MKITKIDYSALKEDVFYKHIYPIYPKEFLFGSNYENFAFLVSANFVLNPQQWEYILEHWEQKESILSIEDTEKPVKEQEVKEVFLTAREKESFELIYNLKKCIEILTKDDILTQCQKDQQAEWIGEAHEYLHKVNPNYYKNANS